MGPSENTEFSFGGLQNAISTVDYISHCTEQDLETVRRCD
jgi:hypothetical protein